MLIRCRPINRKSWFCKNCRKPCFQVTQRLCGQLCIINNNVTFTIGAITSSMSKIQIFTIFNNLTRKTEKHLRILLFSQPTFKGLQRHVLNTTTRFLTPFWLNLVAKNSFLLTTLIIWCLIWIWLKKYMFCMLLYSNTLLVCLHLIRLLTTGLDLLTLLVELFGTCCLTSTILVLNATQKFWKFVWTLLALLHVHLLFLAYFQLLTNFLQLLIDFTSVVPHPENQLIKLSKWIAHQTPLYTWKPSQTRVWVTHMFSHTIHRAHVCNTTSFTPQASQILLIYNSRF